MPTFEQRSGGWRVKVRVKGLEKPLTATFKTKAEAARWALEQEAGARAARRGELPERTVAQAFRRYAEEVSSKKPGERWEAVRLTRMEGEFPGLTLAQLTTDRIGKWRDQRLKQVKASSFNRDLNLLASVLETARREWGWVLVNAARDVRRPTNPAPRRRLMSDHERDRILMALGYSEKGKIETLSQQVGVALLVALESGMRSSEVVGLTWARVHLDRQFVYLPKTKNGDERDVPLSKRAVALLKRMEGVHKTQVFTVTAASRDALFRKARDRCGIEGLTFHDSRATAATRLAKKFDVLTLARILGHRDPRSVMVYYRETAESMAARMDD